jgi:hypothetical protein
MKKNTTHYLLIALTTFSLEFQNINGFAQTISIAAGGQHSLFLCNDNTAMSCGSNSSGQLGDTGTVNRSTPVPVSFFQGVIVSNITAIAGGDLHSLFIRSGGAVWSCGNNNRGQLGNGGSSNQYNPFPASTPSGIIAVAGGSAHSLFLKSDNTVWASGENGNGRLGIGTTVTVSTPVQVSSLNGITAIAGGWFHSLFLKNDGTVWAAGENSNGQLGDGTTVNKSTPALVSSLSGITAISAGEVHSIFLQNNGTVWACGNNASGQLGDGIGGGSPSTPTQVISISNIIAIAAGSNHSLFLKSDGTVWACGDNTYGQLGVVTANISNPTPIQVTSLSGITAVAAGCNSNHSLFLKNDGTVWACGDNTYGQLGDGTTVSKTTPVQVIGLCASSTGIEDTKNNFSFTIYPNPTSGISTINLRNCQAGAKIIVRDAFGNCLLNKDCGNDAAPKIDLGSQSKGIYFLEIMSRGERSVKKIVLE